MLECRTRNPESPGSILDVFHVYKKLLGRTEARTRDMMYCQTIRTVRDISRDDRARIATCSLRTPTDRQTDRLNENYSIDESPTGHRLSSVEKGAPNHDSVTVGRTDTATVMGCACVRVYACARVHACVQDRLMCIWFPPMGTLKLY